MQLCYRQEEFVSSNWNAYDYVAFGYTKADKTVMGAQTAKTEIDVIDGKQYNLLIVMHACS